MSGYDIQKASLLKNLNSFDFSIKRWIKIRSDYLRKVSIAKDRVQNQVQDSIA